MPHRLEDVAGRAAHKRCFIALYPPDLQERGVAVGHLVLGRDKEDAQLHGPQERKQAGALLLQAHHVLAPLVHLGLQCLRMRHRHGALLGQLGHHAVKGPGQAAQFVVGAQCHRGRRLPLAQGVHGFRQALQRAHYQRVHPAAHGPQHRHQAQQANAAQAQHAPHHQVIHPRLGHEVDLVPVRPPDARPGDPLRPVGTQACATISLRVRHHVVHLLQQRVLQSGDLKLPTRCGDPLPQVGVGDQVPLRAQDQLHADLVTAGGHGVDQGFDRQVVAHRAHPAPLPVQRLDHRHHPGLGLLVQVHRRPEDAPLGVALGVGTPHGGVIGVAGVCGGAAGPIDAARIDHQAVFHKIHVSGKKWRHQRRPALSQQVVADGRAHAGGFVRAIAAMVQVQGGRIDRVHFFGPQPPQPVRPARKQLIEPAQGGLGIGCAQPREQILLQMLGALPRLDKKPLHGLRAQFHRLTHHERHHAIGNGSQRHIPQQRKQDHQTQKQAPYRQGQPVDHGSTKPGGQQARPLEKVWTRMGRQPNRFNMLMESSRGARPV